MTPLASLARLEPAVRKSEPEQAPTMTLTSQLHMYALSNSWGGWPKGKTGADDGVLVEFLQEVSPGQQGRLLYLLQDLLMGIIPAPSPWKHASVSLLPKVIGALGAAECRPITILPVMQTVASKVWRHKAAPFLQLQRPSSIGFRPGFQGLNST